MIAFLGLILTLSGSCTSDSEGSSAGASFAGQTNIADSKTAATDSSPSDRTRSSAEEIPEDDFEVAEAIPMALRGQDFLAYVIDHMRPHVAGETTETMRDTLRTNPGRFSWKAQPRKLCTFACSNNSVTALLIGTCSLTK